MRTLLLLLLLASPADALTLDALRSAVASAQAQLAAAPLLWGLAFALAYVAVAALSLPFALPMTLAAGALFGLLQGVVIVSFASTIGAALAFLAARWLLRDRVRRRFGARAEEIDRGLARDGALYLFSLRLIPVVPFVAVNLLAGLTALPLRQFFLVSQLGMLPATLVYVNAGTRLSRLESLAGLLTPPLLASFAALAALPFAARALVAALSRRKRLARWRRPRRFDRNLIVIGAGSAGLVAANVAASAGAAVTLIEQGEMGGDCLNTGCVPSKALIACAARAADVREGAAYGVRSTPPAIDFPAVMARVDAAIAAIAPHDSVARYQGLGVDVRRGRALLVDPWTVEIDGTRLTARAIVLATGAAPVLPDVPGLAEAGAVTSETLWAHLRSLSHAPERVLVVGGGPIGCELAQALARLGSKVTLVERGASLLGREDAEAAALVAQALARDGVEIRLETALTGAGPGWAQIGAERWEGELILLALGRAPRIEGLGLEALGIATGRFIETDATLRTSLPHIFAAGDVAGPHQFTHAAGHQGFIAATNALLGAFGRLKANRVPMPRVTYTAPELAQIGLTAAEAGPGVQVTTLPLSQLDRAVTEGETEGFLRLMTRGRKIVGVTCVGARAGEMIAEAGLAMRAGLSAGTVQGTIHPYPTRGEALPKAVGLWRRAQSGGRLLALARRLHRWRRG